MGLHTGPEYLKLPVEPQPWIVKGVLPVGGKLNIFGKPKLGKSMLGLQLAAAIASGDADWMSFPILTRGHVAYIQIDTPRALWHDRVTYAAQCGLNFDHVYFADDQDVQPYPFNVLDEIHPNKIGEGYYWLKREIGDLNPKPKVVIIDTLREVHAGKEDDSGHMRNVINVLQSAMPGIAMVLISHARKGGSFIHQGGGQPDLMDENRGSGYVAGRMDCVVWLKEKELVAKGRALAETYLSIKQNDETYLFELADPFIQHGLMLLRTAPPSASLREIARHLQNAFPKKSVEACRSLLRRIAKERPVEEREEAVA